MNDALLVPIDVVIDETMKTLDHHSHNVAALSDAEVCTVAVVVAHAFGNHQQRALDLRYRLGYLTTRLSPSRINQRLHALAAWLPPQAETVGTGVVQAHAAISDVVIDNLPGPVCRRVRAGHCGKVRGRAYCGYCAANKEKIFGWRVHLVYTTSGVPVACALLPASYHDLIPLHELLYGLPPDTWVYADKADNSAPDEVSLPDDTGVHLVPIRKDNMIPHTTAERAGLRTFRTAIETVNSQAEAMGMPRLRARTKAGFDLRVWASVLALTALPSTSNHGHMLRLGVQFGNNVEARTTFYVTIIDKGNDRVLCR